ncbi:uncharacterized protein LOC127258884 [Andrographis paniculata]|uniref:uncharacterized protein LOC127258884 n=1 Tax=Andrographis paniculata TaxID=175694 RepID=UPI0021E878B3|nr:uncharacterized protein LOC127258884 [Andrographis paniculata]
MSKKNSLVARRAWNVLRLALLWGRKGGLFRNRLVVNWNVLGETVRKLRHSTRHGGAEGALVYGDREFSFDDTPIIRVKMHRPSSMRFKLPHIPCIKPHVDFDYDFEEDRAYFGGEASELFCRRVSFLKNGEEEEEEGEEEECDEGIDLKAEQFIANFYEQMKLQRQKSYQQYRN